MPLIIRVANEPDLKGINRCRWDVFEDEAPVSSSYDLWCHVSHLQCQRSVFLQQSVRSSIMMQEVIDLPLKRPHVGWFGIGATNPSAHVSS